MNKKILPENRARVVLFYMQPRNIVFESGRGQTYLKIIDNMEYNTNSQNREIISIWEGAYCVYYSIYYIFTVDFFYFTFILFLTCSRKEGGGNSMLINE